MTDESERITWGDLALVAAAWILGAALAVGGAWMLGPLG